MKELEAKNLVDGTFTKAYSEEKFRLFIRNLFHEAEECTEKASNGKYIPEAFRDGVVSYKRLFKFADPEDMEIDVLAVKLKSRHTLENARTMQRNFVARYLNGSRGNVLKDAALVAFYTDDYDEWRFSLVRMDYVLDEEKNKVKKELTPARRFSFLVGGSEKTHTARRQLLPVLQSETETTLTGLEKAFNIETVTKEFFEKYKALYQSLKDSLDKHIEKDSITKTEFDRKHVKTDDFAKRLLGQIVFLYFLQKKGWLGVEKGQDWGTGPKDFLQKLFRREIVEYGNFFNDVLEHLFYDALATERQTQDHFFPALNCRIPFLNGGLFEPFKGYAWDSTDILLDNAIFNDILEVFDLYNFTVREDEPLDKEVAVDPEMLGKVFENLIPENERKGSGTYYTPREIVHYMCQESLINYLDAKLNIESRPTEERGQQSLIPDLAKTDMLTKYEDVYAPVVPRDDLAEFIYQGDAAQERDATAVRKREENPEYKGKQKSLLPKKVQEYAKQIDDALASVKICDPAIGSGAFPVGVMNEIVRARGALTAYLKEEGRTPYDFKRHAIQESIYGVDIEASAVDIAKLRLWLSLVVDEEDFGNIKPLPNLEYKIVAGNSLVVHERTLLNNSYFNELERLREVYFDETSPSQKLKLKDQIDDLTNKITDGVFDLEAAFSEVIRNNKGFDIVVGNPPYGSKLTSEEKNKFKNQFSDVHMRTPDTFNYFISRAFKIVSHNGVVSYIVPNNLLYQAENEKTRQLICVQNKLISAINLGDGVFNSATVPTCIFVTTKATVADYLFQFADLREMPSKDSVNIPDELQKLKVSQLKKVPALVFGLDASGIELIEKIRKQSVTIDQIAKEMACGISTGGDKIYRLSETKAHEISLEEDLLKPVLVGGEIDAYVVNDNNSVIVYIDRKTSIANYPNIESYLFPHKEKLSKRSEVKSGLMPWFSLNRQRYAGLFEQKKIIMRQTSDKIRAVIDAENNYVLDSILVLLLNNEKEFAYEYVLAILNSKLSNYIYQNLTQEKGRTFAQVKPKSVRKLFVRTISPKEQQSFVKIVERLLQNTISYEERTVLIKKIDRMVYQLYDLTPEEIQIIEESV